MTAEETNKWIIPAAKIAGLGFATYLAYRFAQKIGLIKTAEESEAAENIETATKEANASANTATVNPEAEKTKNAILAFNPNYRTALVKAYAAKYYKQGQVAIQSWLKRQFLPIAKGTEYANRIYDASGTFNDNENTLYDVFREIKTQYQLSAVAGLFAENHKADLLEYLKDFLSDKELNIILNMVRNYPQYLA